MYTWACVCVNNTSSHMSKQVEATLKRSALAEMTRPEPSSSSSSAEFFQPAMA